MSKFIKTNFHKLIRVGNSHNKKHLLMKIITNKGIKTNKNFPIKNKITRNRTNIMKKNQKINNIRKIYQEIIGKIRIKLMENNNLDNNRVINIKRINNKFLRKEIIINNRCNKNNISKKYHFFNNQVQKVWKIENVLF